MHSTLLKPQDWSQLEFAIADLGDARLTNRLVRIGSALARCPSGTLPQALPNWPDLKAAYRFLNNPKINHQKILESHYQRTCRGCAEPGEYLIIDDTSDLNYSSHKNCSGLGQIGNQYGRGLYMHTTLVLRVEAWDLEHNPEVTAEGLLGQRYWARHGGSRRKSKEPWRKRLERKRESERWAESLARLPVRPPGSTWIYMGDRESDIYEAFERCQLQQADFIIRAKNNRTLVEEDRPLFAAVKEAPLLGSFEVEVRERKDRKARIAKLEVRAVSVTLKGVWRPEGQRPNLKVNVVEAREVDPPAGEDPIRWVLLTSLPAECFVQARRIVARYAKRWVIEEFHKALKSGANVEKSELETAERIKSLVAVSAVVAVRLLNTKMLARAHPEQPVNAEVFGEEPLEILSAHFGEPAGGWRYGNLFVSIARLGGFLARRHDGDPGWITIWRGWQQLMKMTDGVLILKQARKRCG
jgi:hypothetical protein